MCNFYSIYLDDDDDNDDENNNVDTINSVP